jgi:hypothetical protein
MTSPWKAWKSKSSFPPLSTAPWESRRRREIPTFPPHGFAPDGKVENPKPVSHFSTRGSQRRRPFPFSQTQNSRKEVGRDAASSSSLFRIILCWKLNPVSGSSLDWKMLNRGARRRRISRRTPRIAPARRCFAGSLTGPRARESQTAPPEEACAPNRGRSAARSETAPAWRSTAAKKLAIKASALGQFCPGSSLSLSSQGDATRPRQSRAKPPRSLPPPSGKHPGLRSPPGSPRPQSSSYAGQLHRLGRGAANKGSCAPDRRSDPEPARSIPWSCEPACEPNPHASCIPSFHPEIGVTPG